MNVMLGFMRPMFTNGIALATWITLLLTVNMLLPLFYISTLEGQLVLAAFVAGGLTQTAIFASKGFVRLLGIGHVYWVPLIPWLWTRMGDLVPGELFALWIMAVIGLDSLSLLIDVSDVTRYVSGERTPHLTAG